MTNGNKQESNGFINYGERIHADNWLYGIRAPEGGLFGLNMYSNLMTASNTTNITYWTMNLGQFVDQSFAGGLYIPTYPRFVVGTTENFTGNASESILLKNI